MVESMFTGVVGFLYLLWDLLGYLTFVWFLGLAINPYSCSLEYPNSVFLLELILHLETRVLLD
jgi:hypothetical protein